MDEQSFDDFLLINDNQPSMKGSQLQFKDVMRPRPILPGVSRSMMQATILVYR